MEAAFEIESGLKLVEEMMSHIEQLTADLNNKGVSSYGKDVLVEQLSKCVTACNAPFKGVVKAAMSLLNRCKDLEEKLAQPQKLENEFKDIAKKLNFPITQATTDGVSCKNPNIEMPFEDPVPKKDIEFMQKRLQKTDIDKVVLPKEECLTKKEIATYTDIDMAFAEDRKTLKKTINADKEGKKVNNKKIKSRKANNSRSVNK